MMTSCCFLATSAGVQVGVGLGLYGDVSRCCCSVLLILENELIQSVRDLGGRKPTRASRRKSSLYVW